jgi:hypothetical protein
MSAIYENSSTQTDEGVTETVNAESTHTLCENTDCERYPDDEDFDKDNEEEYEENGEWKKCALCDGYFVDNGFNDLLFISEEPNKKEAQCDLCGKDGDIVQMKGTGECLCGNGCDASDESDDDADAAFASAAEEDAYMEEVKKLQKKYNIKTDKDGVIILPMGSAD